MFKIQLQTWTSEKKEPGLTYLPRNQDLHCSPKLTPQNQEARMVPGQ